MTTVDTLRRIFGAVDARIQITPGWRGADLDRLLDADHARLVDAMATRLERTGWETALEVTYSEYGERGSIDILATRADRRAALVVEAKTDLPSVEATGRKVDEKARLAPAIVTRTLGWRPQAIGRLLAIPDTSRLRRLVTATPALRRMFPADATLMRRWLRDPVGSVAGLVYLPEITPTHRCFRQGRSGRRIGHDSTT